MYPGISVTWQVIFAQHMLDVSTAGKSQNWILNL